MIKWILAMSLVAVFLVGGLIALLRNVRQPMGSPEVLERARRRNLELEEQERRESEDGFR